MIEARGLTKRYPATLAVNDLSFTVLFLLPQLARALPGSWYADTVRWLPGTDVVVAITNTGGQQNLPPHLFSCWGEFGVSASYTAILLILGALLFRSRDA